MRHKPLPSIAKILTALDYNQETGDFFWKTALSNSSVAGNLAGTKGSKGYVSIGIDGQAYRAHRLAWLYVYGEDPGDSEIDHKDLRKDNNAISNLRLVTRKQNNENIATPRNNTSGCRGVSFQKNEKRWTAYIYHNKSRIHIGCFDDLQSAINARQQVEQRLFTHSGIKGGQHGTDI